MKTLYIAILFFLLSLNLFAQWEWQNPLPQGNGLEAVQFVTADIGWAVGELSSVIKTIDGGLTWIVQKSGIGNFKDIHFIDSTFGIIVGGQGIIYRTTNAGKSWTFQNSGTTSLLTGVS